MPQGLGVGCLTGFNIETISTGNPCLRAKSSAIPAADARGSASQRRLAILNPDGTGHACCLLRPPDRVPLAVGRRVFQENDNAHS